GRSISSATGGSLSVSRSGGPVKAAARCIMFQSRHGPAPAFALEESHISKTFDISMDCGHQREGLADHTLWPPDWKNVGRILHIFDFVQGTFRFRHYM